MRKDEIFDRLMLSALRTVKTSLKIDDRSPGHPQTPQPTMHQPSVKSGCLLLLLCMTTAVAVDSIERRSILETNTLPTNLRPWIPIREVSPVPVAIPLQQRGQVSMQVQQQYPATSKFHDPMKASDSIVNSISNIGMSSGLNFSRITPPIAQNIQNRPHVLAVNCSQNAGQARENCEQKIRFTTRATKNQDAKKSIDKEMKTSASRVSQYRMSKDNDGNQSRREMEQDSDSDESHMSGGPEDGLISSRSGRYDGEDDEQSPSRDSRNLLQQPEGEYEAAPEEAAARREQEAAEASEAEAANKSALDEQQQAQREIILQQAQSEARAIKQQQEALMMQQKLQQQMLMRRHHELANPKEEPKMQHSRKGGDTYKGHMSADKRSSSHRGSTRNEERPGISGSYNSDEDDGGYRPSNFRGPSLSSSGTTRHLRKSVSPQISSQNERIQFSDQLSNTDRADSYEGYQDQRMGNGNHGSSVLSGISDNGDDDKNGTPNMNYGQLSDSSTRQASILAINSEFAQPTEMPRKINLTSTEDLLPAAQHHYGSHYGSLGGHHHGNNGYYQFAESHKKGQFDSGFKRGGKKFHISGHAKQHNSHAHGHVKWHGKKGKGSQHWDLEHKDKKHHGGHYGF